MITQQPYNPFIPGGGQQPIQSGYGQVLQPAYQQGYAPVGYVPQAPVDISTAYDQLANHILQDLAGSGRSDQFEVNLLGQQLTNYKPHLLGAFQQMYAAKGTYTLEDMRAYLFQEVQKMRGAIASQRQASQPQYMRQGAMPINQNRPATTHGTLGIQPCGDPWDAYRSQPADQQARPLQHIESAQDRYVPVVESKPASVVQTPNTQPTAPAVDKESSMGTFDTPSITLTADPESNKEAERLYTIPEVQICREFRTFRDNNGKSYDFLDLQMNVPYSSGDQAIEDIYFAYPHLLEDSNERPYAHLLTFPVMRWLPVSYDSVAPNMLQAAALVKENPLNVVAALELIPLRLRAMLTNNIIRQLNIGLATRVSRANTGPLKLFAINDLSDLGSILDLKNPMLENYTRWELYTENVQAVIKAAVESVFIPNRETPILDPDSDDIAYMTSYEGSGIRVQGCGVGRNFDILNSDKIALDAVATQLKRRTVMISNRSVLRTNLVLPEALRAPGASTFAIGRQSAPLHHLLNHALSKQTHPLCLDLRETELERADLWAGTCLTRHLAIVQA